jgi:hypothetical protein
MISGCPLQRGANMSCCRPPPRPRLVIALVFYINTTQNFRQSRSDHRERASLDGVYDATAVGAGSVSVESVRRSSHLRCGSGCGTRHEVATKAVGTW